MRNRLSEADYSAVLSCIEGIYQCTSLDDFPMHTLAQLRKLVDSHLAGYNEVNLARGRILAIVDPPHAAFTPLVSEFAKLMHEHPVITYFDQTGDGQALKISDFIGAKEYHRRAIYRDVYRHMQVEDQIAVGVRVEQGFMIGIAMARNKRSFTEKDRIRLNLVRPHLMRAYVRVAELAGLQDVEKDLGAAVRENGMGVISINASGETLHATPGAVECLSRFFKIADTKPLLLPQELITWASDKSSHDPFSVRQDSAKLVIRRFQSDHRVVLLLSEETTPGKQDRLQRYQLTPRENEILEWVAQGKSNGEIATILGLTSGTVKLHVGRILAKLGVENRTSAAMLARGTEH